MLTMRGRISTIYFCLAALLLITPSTSFGRFSIIAISKPRNDAVHSHESYSLVSSRSCKYYALQQSKLSSKSKDGDDEDDSADNDTALILRIEAEVMAESGVALDQLINPSKVVNLERDLMQLRAQLESRQLDEKDAAVLRDIVAKKEKTLFVEKRAVMRGWLKNLFIGQSVLAAAISAGMVYDALPGFPHLNLEYQVLGFWMWWLFILPSLRARKPAAQEKAALNIAFVATPLVSLALPAVTKDTAIIWWANFACVVAAYVYGFSRPTETAEADDATANAKQKLPSALAAAFKALDYGSGQERGLRK